MGTLIPDANYIYERANGVIYAREFGKHDRVIVGYDQDQYSEQQRRYERWKEILSAANSDQYLKDMLDQIETYYLLKHQSQSG